MIPITQYWKNNISKIKSGSESVINEVWIRAYEIRTDIVPRSINVKEFKYFSRNNPDKYIIKPNTTALK